MDNAVVEERRSYVRGDLSFKIKFRVITQEEYEIVKEVTNLSSSPENMSYDDTISKENSVNTFLIDFLLNIDEKLDQVIAMLRVTPLDENKQSLYRLGVKFLELNTNAKERIISCVFQKQRENIRKSKDKEVTNG